MVKRFLPNSRSGAILFTTRIHALGTLAHTIEVTQMSQEEGIHFLSRRAKLLDTHASHAVLSPNDLEIARTMVELMDGLPLALDQAGSYIEATQCSFSDYQRLFQSARLRLLDERDAHADHPLSVSRTFTLAFEQLKKNNPMAADLLTVCAFLAPDAIPETFFIEGSTHLGPTFEAFVVDPLEFNRAIKALLTYSLIQRNAETKMVTIHRLVQVVLKESLLETERSVWMRSVLQAIDQLFPPNKHQADYWQICERLLPHAFVSIAFSEQWDESEVLHIALIGHVATYFLNRALYAQAETLYLRVLRIGENVSSSEPLLMTEALNGLANLYREQGKYKEAEAFFLRTLHIREQVLGSEHLLVSDVLTGLAHFYVEQGKYKDAEPLYERALHIREQELGELHSQVASSLYNLAQYYKGQGRYELAEPLYQRALSIGKQILSPEHPEVGYSLNGLGMFYSIQGKYEMAEPLYLQTLQIWERALGPEHPNVAYPLVNLGEMCKEQGKYEKATSFYQRALQIWEKALGPNHVLIAHAVYGLGECYREQGKYAEAELLHQRTLGIREQSLGSEHLEVAEPLQGLAQLYAVQGRYKEAESLFQRALVIRQQSLGLQHFLVAETLYHFACFYHLQQQITQALSFYQQALTIHKHALGLYHPKTNATRIAYEHLLQEIGRGEEVTTVEAQVRGSEPSAF